MADPFGIVGVISLAIQITQTVVRFGLDWKDAPHDAKTFLTELQTLKTILSETNTNILLNPDFAEAFQNRPSLLLSQLGPSASSTDTKLMLVTCQKELESLLSELKKRGKGHRVGWERFKGAFLAKDTRESVENLHRQCQILNSMVMIDSTAVGITTYKEVKAARKEQQETKKEQQNWHQAGTKVSLSIKDGVDQLSQGQENQQRQQECQVILEWLTSIDYAPQQNDLIRRRQEGTGQWLLTSHEFHGWLNQDKQTLFCPGIPGAGKTMITSIVVEHLRTKFYNDASVGIAYLYCNFRRQQEETSEALLLSLLKQLIQDRPLIPDSVKSLYENHKQKRTRPSFGEISKALHSVVNGYSRAFIIVDALDECRVSDGDRKQLLLQIFDIQVRTGASLFATSRFIPEIEKEFKGRSAQLEIRASDEDLQRYLDGHMLRLPSFVSRSPDLQKEVKIAIINAANGMYVLSVLPEWISPLTLLRFLIAQLHLDSLIGKRSPKAIKVALEKLPKGSDAYDRVYKEAMDRIEGQFADSEELAKQVLSWITCAKRPLTILELRHALAVEIGEPSIDEDNFPDLEDMVSVCAGLVTVDETSNIIRLVHYTTQEYFERTQKDWFPNAETDIAKACITYLSFDVFKSGFCPTDEKFEARLQLNPLYNYAARNWGHHARAASTEVEQLILDFLENEAKMYSSSQAMMVSGGYSNYSQRIPKQMTGVHLAAYFGLREAMISLLKNGHHPDSKDSDGWTPLSWAAGNGHEAVVKLLLAEDGVNPDFKDNIGQTPLSWAAKNGHEAVVKLLLAENGINPDFKDIIGQTPLSWAAKNGHETVVKLLLAEDGVNPDFKDNIGQTPLSWAAKNGHEAVVKLLLAEDGVDPDSKDSKHEQTPLSWAAENGHEAVVKLLLADGVDPDSTNYNEQTPLSWAAKNGHEAVVKLLLAEDGVDPDSKDYCERTPLSWAAKNGHEAVVKLLLAEDGVDPDSKDSRYGQTPLSWAAENGHEAVVKLLQSDHVLSS
jgi:ankyrin repeat protein